ncbi:MAG: Holliday junction branch migration protein RuvA [Ignavibacteria bacterium]|nr:Holliday junction branch migration protein RuvA [Ignavibacteria bacterium]
MIEYIKGKLVSKKPASAIVESNGIGYLINITVTASDSLGNIGDEVTLISHLHIKENPFGVVLYGFGDENERECFRQIISVSGIGPKTAIGILSAMNYIEFIDLVAKGNYLPLTSIPGVGKKTAERLALELKDKIGKTEQGISPPAVNSGKFNVLGKSSEIIHALMVLGYNRLEADKMVRSVSANAEFMNSSVEDLIREILRGK